MKRLITALGLLALAFYLIFFAPQAVFWIAALATGLLCYREFDALVDAHGVPSPGLVGAIVGIFVLFGPQFSWMRNSFLPALIFAVIVLAIRALRLTDLREILPYIACAMLGALYTFAPWGFAIDLRRESVHLLFFALALNWAGDTVAYYIGRKFGKHRLAPVVSPKKSWEGAIASVIGSIVFGVLYLGYFLPQIAKWEIISMAFLGNIAGQFGDLAESAIKRGAGVKDSGNLLPGHGGILDRLDSSLFALPVVLLFYNLCR